MCIRVWNKNPNPTKPPCRLELSVNVIVEYFFITDLSGCHKTEVNVVELSSYQKVIIRKNVYWHDPLR